MTQPNIDLSTVEDKNIVTIDIRGLPNTGRTYVAGLIKRTLLAAGIKNVDVSNCSQEDFIFNHEDVPPHVVERINERGITYVISDNGARYIRGSIKIPTLKPAVPIASEDKSISDFTIEGADSKEPMAFHSHHIVGPQGCSFTTGRQIHGLSEILVIGNEGFNKEIITMFTGFSKVSRTALIGKGFRVKQGLSVAVDVISMDHEFNDIKDRFNIDLKKLTVVSPGIWFVLKPDY